MAAAKDDALARGFMWICLGAAFLILLGWRSPQSAQPTGQDIAPFPKGTNARHPLHLLQRQQTGQAKAQPQLSPSSRRPSAAAPLSKLIVDLSDRRVYLYRAGQLQANYPVAVGQAGWETPTGSYTILQMQHDPVWQHPITGVVVPPGPQNPLGKRWIGFLLQGKHAIGFHGTNQSTSVGQATSHGCLRMHNKDITDLYNRVAIGTPVTVRP